MEETLKTKVNSIGKEVRDLRQDAQEAADEVLENSRSSWRNLSSRGKDAWRQTRRQGEALMDDAAEQVQRYPLRAVGIALLAGAICGFLIAHNRND